MDKENRIEFVDEETNETIIFDVYDKVEYNGKEYLLVVDPNELNEEDMTGTILKKIRVENEDVIYESVENDEEFQVISRLFEENSDQYDIEMDKNE